MALHFTDQGSCDQGPKYVVMIRLPQRQHSMRIVFVSGLSGMLINSYRKIADGFPDSDG